LTKEAIERFDPETSNVPDASSLTRQPFGSRECAELLDPLACVWSTEIGIFKLPVSRGSYVKPAMREDPDLRSWDILSPDEAGPRKPGFLTDDNACECGELLLSTILLDGPEAIADARAMQSG
jgi:hypothetical protein